MSVQIAVRLPEAAVEFVDSLVSSGAAKSRADFIWHAIQREQRRLAAERDLQILIAQPYAEFEGVHQHAGRRGLPNPD